MSNFYTEDNLRMLVNITKKYLDDKYSYVIEDEKTLRKLVHDTMSEVEEECADRNISLEKKNVAVLTAVRGVYINKHKLTPSLKKPNIQNLSRDRDIFGSRPMQSSMLVPEIDPYQKKTVSKIPKDMNRFMEDRDGELFGPKPVLPDITKLGPVTKEMPEDNDIFMKKLKELEDQRLALEKDFHPPPGNDATFPLQNHDESLSRTLESMMRAGEMVSKAAESIAHDIRTLCEEIRKMKMANH